MSGYPEFVPNLVGGQEQGAASGLTLDVVNPHDGSVIAKLARGAAADVEKAVAAAAKAQQEWGQTPGVRRGDILHAIANSIEAHRDELAALVTTEAGKRMADSRGEVGAAVQCARFFAGEGQRLFGRTMPSNTAGRWAMTVRRPCGVAGLIIAANTPAPNFAWKVFPALICGNGVVLKPAEQTPASSWFMAKVAEDAGLPRGLLNVVHGLGAEAGQAIVDHPQTPVISFTGSTAVGRRIAETAGKQLKKVSLELGGKNAMVICEDADLDNAVRWAIAASFSNAGQRCAASSRIVVFDKIYDAFTERFAVVARALKLGIADDCEVGPVISARQLSNMSAVVDEAVAAGARVLCGGRRATDGDLAGGFYMAPTIIDQVDKDAEISGRELFGPVAVMYRVPGFEQALALANHSNYGLTAAIHTRDVDRALTFANRVRAGVVVVNAGTHGSEPHMPFGGVKASGNGSREPGTEALDVYSDLRDIYLNVREELPFA